MAWSTSWMRRGSSGKKVHTPIGIGSLCYGSARDFVLDLEALGVLWGFAALHPPYYRQC